jgi:hypothetical protein
MQMSSFSSQEKEELKKKIVDALVTGADLSLAAFVP